MTKRIPPQEDVFSIDHMIPLASGGDNAKDNLCVCCFQCNIIKGTMTAKTFSSLITILKQHAPELIPLIFREMQGGRFANKLEREKELKLYEVM